MPGKKKKTRKPERGGQSAKKSTVAERGNRNPNGFRAQGKALAKTFSLKDEAQKSTFRSSRRLWQGEGQKLRHLPVEFIRAVDIYDPGQYLRERLEANARKTLTSTDVPISQELVRAPADSAHDVILEDEDARADNAQETLITGEASPQDESLRVAPTRVETVLAVEDETDEIISEDDASDMDYSRAADALHDEASDTEANTNEEKPCQMPVQCLSPDPSPTSTSASAEELEVSTAVRALHIQPTDEAPKSAVNFDSLLESLVREDERDDEENEICKPSVMTSNILESTDVEPTTDSELFVVDVEGDTTLHVSGPVNQEEILLKPRQARTTTQAQTPVASISPSATTPWARTLNDPVIVDAEMLNIRANPKHFGHAFESSASTQRGKRGGRRKQEKQRLHARAVRADDSDIMLDYMENARWTDEEDDIENEEDVDENSAAEPLINQILAGLHSRTPAGEGLPELDQDEDDLDSSTTGSEDDTDIDDDLELMIDAEMEEMEFDLGYSGGRSGKGNRLGTDRELVDSALYHEDFNVFDYNSAGEEPSGDEVAASGARKRGLNKFIDSLDLSDEELEATLIAQWKKDRGSKKEKKRERQRLHQSGVLGKKAKRARASHEVDIKSQGELDGFHGHIKRFVSHVDYIGIEELPMPAMEKSVRRAVHLLSQAYGLKTASQGSGKRRHIVLYKTKHAAVLPDTDYVEETLVRARRVLGVNTKYRDTLLPESVLKKLGRSGKSSGKFSRDGGGGGRLRDGDIVGADAPEIAIENKGRRMLEKLGWLHGSGLGAVGNQGISLPLCATIKNTKYGLATN